QAQESAARSAREAIAGIGSRRGEQEKALAAQQEALARLLAARAVANLSGGAPDALRVALSGEDLVDAARRLHYLSYVSRDAARMIDTQRAGIAELGRLKEASETKAKELAAAEADARDARESLLKERREQRRVFERVSAEVRSARREMKQLQADEARLA